MSKRKEGNRDVNRQNMATSVVRGCMYSYVSDIGNREISKVAKKLLSKDDDYNTLSYEVVKGLQHISNLSSLNTDANLQSRNLFMKSSTYLKKGAEFIAKSEIRTITDAIDDN